jgi:hypothetical protein
MTDVAAAGEAAVVEKAGTTEPDDVEAKARDQGWRPKEEWTGKPEHWKDAATYIEHGDLRATNKRLEDRLARVERTTETAISNLKKQHEKELADLKAEKRAAVAKGDVKAVDAIDEQIDALKASTPEKVSASGTDAPEDKHEVQADWLVDNPWYDAPEHEAMTRYAMKISQGYAEEHPKASMKENLSHVDTKMRAKFPDFEWGKQTAPTTKTTGANGHAPVDGGGISPGRREREAEIPEDDLKVGRQLVAAGAFPDLAAWKKVYRNG